MYTVMSWINIDVAYQHSTDDPSGLHASTVI